MPRILIITMLALLLCLPPAAAHAQTGADPYAGLPTARAADGAFVLGDPQAGVKLIEFSDYLCTSCQNYEPIIQSFLQDYVLTGRAQYEYRIYPVIDPQLSVRSASLVECADTLRPGQFWRARDLMFELVSSRGFTDETIALFAERLGHEAAALSQCADKASQHITDARYGLALGASATPSLFVQYGEAAPLPIALALPEHYQAIVNAIRPASTAPVLIEQGRYAGLTVFRRADGGFALGDPAAPISIVAFEDFLCPHCQTYQSTVDAFVDEYVRSGEAQFEFRFYPVVNPQFSTTFAKTAECAAAQDLRRFWDAHDLLFELARRGDLAEAASRTADLLALDAAALQSCLDRAMQFLVDTQLAQNASVSGTPALRARRENGDLELIYLGDQPITRGAPTLFQLRDLMAGGGNARVGPPERSLLDERFLADASFLSGQPCAPPCWQNVIPGETTLADALEIVGAIDGLALRGQTDQAFQFGRAEAPACCQISADDSGMVNAIILQFAPRMTIGDALDRYGEPLFFRGQPYAASEALLWFYYPERYSMIQVVVPGVDGALEASSPLVAAYYLTEMDMSEAVASGAFSPWKGFVAYGEYAGG